MADTRFRITTPLFFILANFAFGDVTPDIIVQSNGNFTLQPNVQSPPEDILWTWNENKVVEFYQEEMVTYGQFKGRMTLDLTTGALTLTNLTEADSGEYVGELQIKGTLVKYRQTVKVFDAVGKPAVTCQVNGSSVTLLCSGGDRPSTQHRWEGPAIESQPGSQLNIEAAESSDAIYTCVLHNPVGESRTEFPVKSCFPAPGSASVIISVVIVLLLFIIVGLLLFYYKKFYKKTQNEEDMEAQSGEGQQLLPADPKNIEETPGRVGERVKQYENMTSPGKTHDEDQKTALTEQHKGTDGNAGISQEESQTVRFQESAELGKDMQNPGKTQDEHQKTALIEQHKETDESAGISQKESQTGSQNQAEDSEERGVVTEGGNSKPPSSGTVPFSAPESPPAAPPKTGSADETVHPPKSSPSPPHPPNSPSHPATTPVQNQDQEAETKTAAESTDETGANQRAGAQRQREKRGGQDEESLNQGEDSEERGVETEGGNSKHPSPGTVPFSDPESSPKTGNEEQTFPTLPSSPSPPHPPKSPPHPAPALVQSKDQEEETDNEEDTFYPALSSQSESEDSDGGGAQPSGAGGGGAENPKADPAQELPSSPEEEKDILRRVPDTDGGAAQCSEAGGGGDGVPKPDSDQDINPRSAEETLSVPLTEPLSTGDLGLSDTTARSPPHTGASEESCCAEESPTSGPNPEPNSTPEAEEEKKRGREERKDSQDTPPVKPQRTYIP